MSDVYRLPVSEVAEEILAMIRWLRRWEEQHRCPICNGRGDMCVINADIFPLKLTPKARRCGLCRGRGWTWRKP